MTAIWSLSHDFTFIYGGAERVTEALAHDVLPEARVYVLSGHEEVLERMGLSGRAEFVLPPRIVTDGLYRAEAPAYAPLLPLRRPIDGNLVSSSYAFAHHLRCTGRHVVYCHSPLRQAWTHVEEYARTARSARPLVRASAAWFRILDRRAVRRCDAFVATSTVVKERIERFWGVRDVPIVPPPVDLAHFRPRSEKEDFFVWAGRIVEPYKRLIMLVRAFEGLSERLVIAGAGRDEERVRAAAPPNVEFAGQLDSAALADLYGRARALIFPGADDFGIVPVEAMACGTPVIAFAGGGALDTVKEGVTGLFFRHPTEDAISAAIRDFQAKEWPAEEIARHAAGYGRQAFARRMQVLLAGT